jgi:heme-degrading monooxygenase HmoA
MKALLPAVLLTATAVVLAVRADDPKRAAPKAAVARVWQGKVPKAKADEYEKYLTEAGVQKLRAIKGNMGVQMFRRDLAEAAEFVVISYWPDRATIKAYAGDDIEKVRHLPRDKEYLIDPDEHVRHYDVRTDDRGD